MMPAALPQVFGERTQGWFGRRLVVVESSPANPQARLQVRANVRRDAAGRSKEAVENSEPSPTYVDGWSSPASGTNDADCRRILSALTVAAARALLAEQHGVRATRQE